MAGADPEADGIEELMVCDRMVIFYSMCAVKFVRSFFECVQHGTRIFHEKLKNLRFKLIKSLKI